MYVDLAPSCVWISDEADTFYTECGMTLEALQGHPSDAGWHYCPYCGQSLAVIDAEDCIQV